MLDIDMMQTLFSILLCVGVVLIMFAGRNRLRLDYDYFFILFLSFAVLYLVISPIFTQATQGGIANAGTAAYPYLGVSVVSMFLVPLVLIYRILANGMNGQQGAEAQFDLSESRLVLLCTFFLAFEAAFTVLAVDNGMYVRRIGTEEIAEIVSGVDMATLLLLRTHDVLAIPVITLLAILLPTIKRQMRSGIFIFSTMALIILVVAFVVFAIVNSRALIIFLLLGLYFAYLIQQGRRVKLGKASILVGVAILYGLTVVSNIRNHGVEANISEVLNPIGFATNEDSQAFSSWEWSQRLDCLNLISQMDESLQSGGYEWGLAWERPLVSLFGQTVGLEKAAEYKANAITTAKTYLMEKHTNISTKDYPSCMVTDLWGNFWIYGLPIAAGMIAVCFVILRRCLTSSSFPAVFIAALVFSFYFVIFEKEFIDWLLGWIKLVPGIVLLVLLNPIKRIRRMTGSDKVES